MGRADFSDFPLGPYFLTNLLGAGASGNVYRAVDTTSKRSRSFAVKCVSRANLTQRQGVRLVSEISYHYATADCPNVVTLRDMMDEHQHLFLVFDLCDTDMRDAILEKKYWGNDARIRKAFVQTVDALSACHARSVFHRDLKPDNIMCNSRGTGIRIGDFGMATHHPVSVDGGCGTRKYMSPECLVSCKGDPYNSVAADVWSLGVVLLTMVTSSHAWNRASPSDEGFMAFLEDEDYLLHVTPISEGLCALLRLILHPVPARRPSLSLIRKKVLELDTFYSWDSPDDAWSTEVVADGSRTCVECAEPVDDKKKYNKYAAVSSYTKRR